MYEGPQFIHKKDSKLHTSPEVEHEQARRKLKKEKLKRQGKDLDGISGVETSHKPADKLAAYFELLERTHGHREDPRVLERIKNYYHKQYVIKENEIPESYFELQQRLAREQGHGDIEITPEMRQQLTEVIISDQESTLGNWLDYLTSDDATYPMWAKYWAFTSIVELSKYDKEKKLFDKRTKGTTAPFPELDREAFAYTVDAVIKKANKEAVMDEQDNPEFQTLLQGANFGKLYAYAIEKVTPAKESELVNVQGKWIKYEQNSDHMPLVRSLQGHGTGWCTAGESTAETQLKGGDFYVYYSYDEDGNPTIPRTAIRMEGHNKIAEVRGIAHEQNLDPYIGDVVEEKMQDFGTEGESYKKKATDMKLLTAIEEKARADQPLAREDLIFLYEIDAPIEGFGYQRDPRIVELRATRDPEQDILTIFEATPDQIAHSPQEIHSNTKAYVGALETGIFQLTQQYGIEHIYTSFPEGKIQRYDIVIGGKTKEELEQELKSRKDIWVNDWAKDIIGKPDFTTSQESKDLNLVRLTVADLGFPNGATTDEIYQRADELGLDLCPVEVGPQLRLKSDIKEWTLIGMEQIPDSDGDPDVFFLDSGAARLELGADDARSGRRWYSGRRWLFSLRKLDTSSPS